MTMSAPRDVRLRPAAYSALRIGSRNNNGLFSMASTNVNVRILCGTRLYCYSNGFNKL